MKKKIIGRDLADLRKNIINVLMTERYFQCDVCTGNYYVNIEGVTKVCSQNDAFEYFYVFMGDKCYLGSVVEEDGEKKIRTTAAKKEDLRNIFNTLEDSILFNSRIEKFRQIPKWDGKPRIDTFMRDVFDCNTNPNFFRLYLTAICGKMSNPKNSYVPFFFDFVGAKGVGKSLLHSFLVGSEYVQEIEPTSRLEDVCATIYSMNSVIAIDDECLLTGGGRNGLHAWSEDKLKSFVTRSSDTFSRKFCQPERRDRAFVFVRTSNTVKVSTDPDERRQIIFESCLPAKTTRLFKYGKENFAQLMAEAKEYYLENGVYQLSTEDWISMEEQQGKYSNDETMLCDMLRKFIDKQIRRIELHSGDLTLQKYNGKYSITWNDFERYRVEELHYGQEVSSGKFWHSMRVLASKGAPITIETARTGEYSRNNKLIALINAEPGI